MTLCYILSLMETVESVNWFEEKQKINYKELKLKMKIENECVAH